MYENVRICVLLVHIFVMICFVREKDIENFAMFVKKMDDGVKEMSTAVADQHKRYCHRMYIIRDMCLIGILLVSNATFTLVENVPNMTNRLLFCGKWELCSHTIGRQLPILPFSENKFVIGLVHFTPNFRNYQLIKSQLVSRRLKLKIYTAFT